MLPRARVAPVCPGSAAAGGSVLRERGALLLPEAPGERIGEARVVEERGIGLDHPLGAVARNGDEIGVGNDAEEAEG